MEKSGVYKLTCNDCPTAYIGQTGRKLEIRVREHEAAFRKKIPEKSNFAAHLLNAGHSFSSPVSYTHLTLPTIYSV